MSKKDYFDFKEDSSLITSFSEDYLRQYYHPTRSITDDEKATFNFIQKVSPKLNNIKSCIEVGCGPTIHHAIMIAPFVETIDFSDYLEENLAHVQRWIKGEPDAWDWSTYAKYCLEKEGHAVNPQSVKSREDLTRKKAKSILPINVLSSNPLGNLNLKYDLVATFYCTEEVALTNSRWREVMKAITTLVKPGGQLLISCLEDTDFYHIQTPDGASKDLPCARVTKNDLCEVLAELGYEDDMIVEVQRTPEQVHEGVNGVVSALAKLKA